MQSLIKSLPLWSDPTTLTPSLYSRMKSDYWPCTSAKLTEQLERVESGFPIHSEFWSKFFLLLTFYYLNCFRFSWCNIVIILVAWNYHRISHFLKSLCHSFFQAFYIKCEVCPNVPFLTSVDIWSLTSLLCAQTMNYFLTKFFFDWFSSQLLPTLSKQSFPSTNETSPHWISSPADIFFNLLFLLTKMSTHLVILLVFELISVWLPSCLSWETEVADDN